MSTESADILCVQETKAGPEQLSEDLQNPQDSKGNRYHSYWASANKKGYSGTAIYSIQEPVNVAPMGIREFDEEGRVLQADFGQFILISAYFPNSQDGGARLAYKLDFCAAILELCNSLVAQGRHIILCGDFNIAHRPIDLARPRENEKNPGYLPEERAWMDVFTTRGYVDTFRHFRPTEGGHYSWWSYRAAARARNIGWRIDYHCVNQALIPLVEGSIIRPEVPGSDHCPVELILGSFLKP